MYRDCVNRPRGPVTQSTLCISSCVLPRPRGIFTVFRGGGSCVRQSGADHPSAPPGAQDLDEVPLEGTARIRQRFYLNVSELLCGQNCRLMPFGRVASAVAPHPSLAFAALLMESQEPSLRGRAYARSLSRSAQQAVACRASRAPGPDGPLAPLPARAVAAGESRSPHTAPPSTRISRRRGPPAASPARTTLLTSRPTPPDRE